MTLIQASTTSLTSSAPQFQMKGGVVDGYSADVQSSLRSLSDTLSGMSELGSFDGNLQTLGTNLKIVMQCHSDALHRTSQGLLTTAQSFQNTDADMASTLKAVEVGLEPFTGYEVPVPKPAPSPPSQPWYASAWKWVAGAGVAVGGAIGSAALATGEGIVNVAESPAVEDIAQLLEELPV